MIAPLLRIPSYLVHRIIPTGNFILPKNFVSFTTKTSSTAIMDQNNMVGREIDLLETKDLRFRLPGNVGIKSK
ncbi:hypothetical protein BLA29_013371 [Euroglyphus maynei]|uniref:Uncharacterized protein n=1 Tax=Euroglyphus maynei TaxID=6958 RepID=A0A1Y3BL74_EURMA|nr:hypothetical protein BLA29_013371 [Euroglyphus maynei]